MKNGKRPHRWRLWHARRKYYRSPAYVLDRLNTVTIEGLRAAPNCLHDVIFTETPLQRLMNRKLDLYAASGTEIHRDIAARLGESI